MKGFYTMCCFVGTHGCFMRLVTAGHKPRTAAEMVLCVFSSGTKPCKTTISSSKCFLNDIALFNEQDARFHVGVLVRLSLRAFSTRFLLFILLLISLNLNLITVPPSLIIIIIIHFIILGYFFLIFFKPFFSSY